MGQTTAETVGQIEQTRRRLDSQFEELERYLPPTTEKVKRVAVVVGGIGAALVLHRYLF